jgi:predicted enzyme related to lactoylglutathione lyase
MWSHGSFHWNELMSHDVERAKRFYAATIGWEFDSMPIPEGTYWVARVGGKPVAGIFEMRGPQFTNMAERWLPYLAVDDIGLPLREGAVRGCQIHTSAL